MTFRRAPIDELTNAVEDIGAFLARLAGRELAVFLDYDGTLTPIVDRPEDAVISDEMRDAVRRLSGAAACAWSAAAIARSFSS